MITITHYKGGLAGVQCHPGEALYALGMKPANHLPPAIRQGFEWGWDCLRERATLLHWEQGVYEEGPNGCV